MLQAVVVGELHILWDLLSAHAKLRRADAAGAVQAHAQSGNKGGIASAVTTVTTAASAAVRTDVEFLLDPVYKIRFSLPLKTSTLGTNEVGYAQYSLNEVFERVFGLRLDHFLKEYYTAQQTNSRPPRIFDKVRTIGLIQSQIQLQARRAFRRFASAPLRGTAANHKRFTSHYRCIDDDDQQARHERLSFVQLKQLASEIFDKKLLDSRVGEHMNAFDNMCSGVFARMQDGSGSVSEKRFVENYTHLVYLSTLTKLGKTKFDYTMVSDDEDDAAEEQRIAEQNEKLLDCDFVEGDRVRYTGPLQGVFASHPGQKLGGRFRPWQFCDTGIVEGRRMVSVPEIQRYETAPSSRVDVDQLPGVNDDKDTPGARPFTPERLAAEAKREAMGDKAKEQPQKTGSLAAFLAEEKIKEEGGAVLAIDVIWDNVRFAIAIRPEHLTVIEDEVKATTSSALDVPIDIQVTETEEDSQSSQSQKPQPTKENNEPPTTKTDDGNNSAQDLSSSSTNSSTTNNSGDKNKGAEDKPAISPAAAAIAAGKEAAKRQAELANVPSPKHSPTTRELNRRRLRRAASKRLEVSTDVPGGKMSPELWVDLIQKLPSPVPSWYAHQWSSWYCDEHYQKAVKKEEEKDVKEDTAPTAKAATATATGTKTKPPTEDSTAEVSGCSFPVVPTSTTLHVLRKWGPLVRKLCETTTGMPVVQHVEAQTATATALWKQNSRSSPKWLKGRINLEGAVKGYRIY